MTDMMDFMRDDPDDMLLRAQYADAEITRLRAELADVKAERDAAYSQGLEDAAKNAEESARMGGQWKTAAVTIAAAIRAMKGGKA